MFRANRRVHCEHVFTRVLLHSGKKHLFALIQINSTSPNVICKIFQEWRNSDAIAVITYVTLFISFTFNVFIFCYIGEILTEQVFANEFR